MAESGSGSDFLTLVLTSSAIATVVTTIAKFAFDAYVLPRLQNRRSADEIVSRLRPPLVESAEAVVAYLRLFLRFHRKKWYTADDPYFRLSLLYAFGQFFGWYHVVQTYAHPEFDASSRVTKDYWKYANRALKALNGFGYQRGFSQSEKELFDLQEIPRRTIQAVGELMIVEDDSKDLPRVIGFVEFADKIGNDDNFKTWFKYLDTAFRCIEDTGRDNLYFQRMVIFTINLQVFVQKLHPDRFKRIRKKLILYDVDRIDPRSRDLLLAELAEENVTFESPYAGSADARRGD